MLLLIKKYNHNLKELFYLMGIFRTLNQMGREQ